jgi:hypothetical protein
MLHIASTGCSCARRARAAESWPVETGRQPTTRWTLIGSDFDIVEWIEAK